MKKEFAKFLRKFANKVDSPKKSIKNYQTYLRVCKPAPNIVVNGELMITEISRRTGIDEDTVSKMYDAEYEIMDEIGLII